MRLKTLLPYSYFHYYLFSIVIGLLAINNYVFLVFYAFLFFKIKEYRKLFSVVIVTILVVGYCFIHENSKKRPPQTTEFQVINVKSTTYNNQYIVKQGFNKYLMYSNELLNIGDNIKVDYELREFRPPSTPNGFNYLYYYGSQKIYYELKITNITVVNNSFHLNKIREKIKDIFINLPTNTKSYVYMFVFGENIFADNFNEAKVKLGIAHLFALSGLHIHMLIAFIKRFYRFFRLKPNNGVILLVLLIYLFLAGNSFSLLRAVLMVVLQMLFSKKGISSLDALSFSFIIILLFRPFARYNYGFILSYLVSFFIITMPKLQGYKQLVYLHSVSYLSSLLIISNLNGGIYLLTIFTSVIYSYIFPFIMPLIFLSLIPKVCVISEPIFTLINKFTINIAISPFIKFSFQPLIVIVIYIIVVAFLFISSSFKQIVKRFIILVLFLSGIYLSFYLNPFYKVEFLDVGQGDSTLIKNPFNKGNILIDAHSGTYSYLKSLGPIEIDYFFITHGDYDHASEAVEIVKNIKVTNIYLNPYDKSNIALELKKHQANIAYPGNTFYCGKIKIEILGPLHDYQNTNNNSLVIKITTPYETILFTGDIEKEAELDLVNKYQFYLKSDILHIAHHGSNTSTTSLFLKNVNPAEAIISVGKYNYYNHPSREILERLNNKGVKFYLTSEKQTIRKKRFYLKIK